MTTAQQYDDPFAGADKVPSISFKNAEVGTVFEGVVTEAPKLVQSRDFNTGEPAFWPAKPGEAPNPKMSVVIRLLLEGDEERSLWAQKPSAMFAALAEAQKQAGARIEVGGVLAVKFTGEKAHTDPEKVRKNLPPQKLYAARYTPPPPKAAADPFDTPAAAPAAPANDKGWGTSETPPF